jgi:acetyl/propionyl-CoA carboxylase alpha subunit
MFERILIAGRGEASARVARTCQRIGADTVALAAPGDEEAVHVQACDEVVKIEDVSVYRDPDRLVALALEHNCVAIHPAYGFFDSDPWLAARGAQKGVTVVGPSADRLALYRDRAAMRVAAVDAGLRVLAGADALVTDAADAMMAAREIGYPLVVKAGLGVGEPSTLEIAHTESELLSIVGNAEDPIAFALEAWVDRPRHVEIVLVSDGDSDVAVISDHECSVRKDHRRVIGESPAPAIDALRHGESVRGAMWAAASQLAIHLGHRGTATVQFLLDERGQFYFVAFRPGLGPEHVLAEMRTGVDLVEADVRLALGEPIPQGSFRTEPTGHAVQARLEAALDPRDQRPFPGRTDDVRWPPAPTGKSRIETAIQNGSKILSEHDPLVATITTFCPTRHEAVLLLDRMVAETRIAPLITNLRLVRRALNHESFRACQVDEGFLDRA